MIRNNGWTKYEKLMEYLKQQIRMGQIKPGDRIPSEHALAENFGLSRQTVRKAISLLAHQGYLRTEHGRGTFCAGTGGKKTGSRNIGVITTYISEYIFPRVIQGIDRVLEEKGYSLILKNTGNDTAREAAHLEEMLDKGMDGLIIEPTKSALFSPNLEYYRALDRCGIPYVFLHSVYQQLEGKPRIMLEDAAGMQTAVRYLGKLGHRNMAGIFKADDLQGLNRHRGYARGLKELGIAYDPDLVIWFHTEDKDIKPQMALKQLLESGQKVDAVLCYNDEVAFRIYEMLRDLGMNVPGDISITGFDDSYFSANCPVRITTLSHPKDKLGEAAARLLIGILEGEEDLQQAQQILVPELVEGESCRNRL